MSEEPSQPRIPRSPGHLCLQLPVGVGPGPCEGEGHCKTPAQCRHDGGATKTWLLWTSWTRVHLQSRKALQPLSKLCGRWLNKPGGCGSGRLRRIVVLSGL